ncbi:MAG: endolytic transglycosylase MltG [Desulfobulbaceae bacterium]|jgi:UPF0755 protein|nr:endolytic transglycosylase MltG [Desulfobulbaceae bacterium]
MRNLLLFFLLFILVAASGVGFWYRSYLTTVSPGSGEVVVVLAKGIGVRGVGEVLAKNSLLGNDIRYLLLVYFSGFTARLQAGEYSIPRGLTPPEVLRLLINGSTLRHHVTIVEGTTAEQMAAIFEKDGWVKRAQFLELVHDANYISRLGVDAPQLEGYLFPETYTLSRQETDAISVTRMMVNRFQHVWNEIKTEDLHGLNLHQLVTLASVVEKETGAAVERPLIARVFLNRLAQKMRLQSDPTVIYGIREFNGNLTKSDLKRVTPYNTYVIPALPLGPICNPGRAALEAVLHPADSDALYFVSKNDGTHFFSNNLADHNRAVEIYQRGR